MENDNVFASVKVATDVMFTTNIVTGANVNIMGVINNVIDKYIGRNIVDVKPADIGGDIITTIAEVVFNAK
jgi:hypothetical protein